MWCEQPLRNILDSRGAANRFGISLTMLQGGFPKEQICDDSLKNLIKHYIANDRSGWLLTAMRQGGFGICLAILPQGIYYRRVCA